MMRQVLEELAPGMLVGRYQLLFRLGKGGMGEVWAAAQNVSHFGFQKLIALKVLRTQELTSNAAKMFFDEAKAASSLQHPAIVPTVDLGRDGDVLFIAMDMVRGPSLTALLQRLVINKSTMSPSVVTYIGGQIASALDYAHERATFEGKKIELIHRDVSPHNVLLDLNGSVRLTDFGVARTAIQEHESHVGTVRGKPSYMAPEQVLGVAIDARSDIFSLGIVLYECSCLKRLFGRSNPVKSMDAVLKHNPKPLVELVPGFPPDLWQVISRALQKDPRDRFQRAADFADALVEASRSLTATGRATRELCTLIAESFEPNAFDLEGRVNELLGESPTPSPTGGDAPEQEGDPTRLVARLPRAASAGLATRVFAWPTAEARDPLSPEAIEEARTAMYSSGTPPGMVQLGMASLPSIEGVTPFTGQSMTLQRKATSNAALIGLLCFAAVLLLGTAFVVVRHRTAASVGPELDVTKPESPSAAAVRATAKPPESAVAVPVAGSDSADEGSAAPLTKEPGRIDRKPRKTVASAAAPQMVKRAEEAEAPKLEPSGAAANATRDEVLKLIRRVKAIDPKAASEMYPTLNEASADNAKVLNDLRSRARAILARVPAATP